MSFLYNQWDGYVVTRILSPSALPTTSTFSQVTEQVWRKCQGVFSQIICDVKVWKCAREVRGVEGAAHPFWGQCGSVSGWCVHVSATPVITNDTHGFLYNSYTLHMMQSEHAGKYPSVI